MLYLTYQAAYRCDLVKSVCVLNAMCHPTTNGNIGHAEEVVNGGNYAFRLDGFAA